jgi:hypothetical protein
VLAEALAARRLDLAERSLKRGANIHLVRYRGVALLRFAELGNLEAVQFLLQRGVDPLASLYRGIGPRNVLHFAVRSGNPALVSFLLWHKVFPTDFVNHTFYWHFGVDTREALSFRFGGQRTLTALDYALLLGNRCVQQRLRERGAGCVGYPIRTGGIRTIVRPNLAFGTYWHLRRLLYLGRMDPSSALYRCPLDVCKFIDRFLRRWWCSKEIAPGGSIEIHERYPSAGVEKDRYVLC